MKYSHYTLLALLFFACLACQESDIEEESGSLFQEVEQTGLDNINQLSPSEEVNIITYLYYYNGGGVAAGDINNDGLVDIFFSNNQKENRLYLNEGDWKFTDITSKAGVGGQGDWTTGVSMVDVNGDGWLDIYVCQVSNYLGFEGGNELYINQQDGTFKESAAEYGLDFQGFGTQAYWLDYDQDGDLDCYLLNHSVHSNATYGPASNRKDRDEAAGDRLLRQDQASDGQINFVDVSESAGIYQSKIGYGLSASIADFNDDALPDIYVANDFSENDYLYLNQGDGSFRESIRETMGHSSKFSMGSDAADYDNDGAIDLLTLDMKPGDEIILKSSMASDAFSVYRSKELSGYHYQFPRNHLQKNQGKGQFSEVGEWAGIAATDWSWGGLFADLDQDGLQDIVVSNGIMQRPNDLDYLKFTANAQLQESLSNLDLAAKMPSGLLPNVIFQHISKGKFVDQSANWGMQQASSSTGMALADLDGDGDLDMVINNVNASSQVFRNNSKAGNWLSVALSSVSNNKQAIGAKILLFAGDQVQTREINPVRGFQSSGPAEAHFGLGDLKQVDSVLVRWVDGSWTKHQVETINQRIVLSTGQIGQNPNPTKSIASLIPASHYGIDYQHQENEYFDFDVEGLQPYFLSRQGPAAAAVTWQGQQYIYLGGAHDQAPSMYRLEPDQSFRKLNIPDFLQDAIYEDTDALFFDADGDGDPDLYVVSGGGQIDRQGYLMEDRLYFNQNGSWQRKKSALPIAYINGACVTSGDFDGDQDMDLFIGGRSIPDSYGLPGYSYILENDGNGQFNRDTLTWTPNLERIGMVTDALWSEDQKNLLVVGHWMPFTQLRKEDQKWSKSIVPDSEGWWNCLQEVDLDADGQNEILAGNWGLNSPLKASPSKPLRLYVADFDGNQRTDPLLTYMPDDLEYSFYSKDDLSTQIPPLRRNNVTYAEFATRPFRDVMPPAMLANAYQTQVKQMASCLFTSNGQDDWQMKPLSDDLQLTPIYAFAQQAGQEQLLVTGGEMEVQPSIGRQESIPVCLASNGPFEACTYLHLSPRLAGRQIIHLDDGRFLLLTNDGPAFILP